MKEASELLMKGLELLRISYSGAQIEAFSLYLTELKKWSRAYNLTALKTDADIVVKHFLDSLLFLKVLPPQVKSIADVGSGAGFPGLPLKIMRPDIAVVLIEPVQKKALFLEHMQRQLKVDGLSVRNCRIEDIHDLLVDAAVTRALFSVGEFINKAERLLEEGGVLILSKGPKLEEELRGLETSAVKREDIVLPFENSMRHLVIIEKRSQK
ncbi:MAG: 16S rRNA (guanine(527)-N(7))-methyltransferase RsmG [Nitrospirae bacterium]|nr:16S rRNA (guanine(527)-N(7))-methyltransferase RsmG [Nitrospirota bacterium]